MMNLSIIDGPCDGSNGMMMIGSVLERDVEPDDVDPAFPFVAYPLPLPSSSFPRSCRYPEQASLGLEHAHYGHYFQLQGAFQGSLLVLGD